jgi:hypothetical protein
MAVNEGAHAEYQELEEADVPLAKAGGSEPRG